MKFPNVNAEQCYEIINFVKKNNNKRPMTLKYNISYYQIDKIIKILSHMNNVADMDIKINEIRKEIEDRGVLCKNGVRDYAVNYMRYKEKYTKYNHERQRRNNQ